MPEDRPLTFLKCAVACCIVFSIISCPNRESLELNATCQSCTLSYCALEWQFFSRLRSERGHGFDCDTSLDPSRRGFPSYGLSDILRVEGYTWIRLKRVRHTVR
jgi:hypothetical protein